MDVRYLISLILLLMFSACRENKAIVSSIQEEEIYLLPDSLLTQEQLEKKKEYIQKIQAIVMEYVKVDSNSMEFTMKKQEFLKTGLVKGVIDINVKKIKKEMKMNNCFLKENNIKNLEVSW